MAADKELDRLDRENKLTRTILYNNNPRDNEVLATEFTNGGVAGAWFQLLEVVEWYKPIRPTRG